MFASYKTHLQDEKAQEGKNKCEKKDSVGSDKTNEEESDESITLLKAACDRVCVLDENIVTHEQILERLKKCCSILEILEAYDNDLSIMAASTVHELYFKYISQDDRIKYASHLVDFGFTSK